MDVSNSVVGPPSNIAISPDGRLALVASSVKYDASNESLWSPDTLIHVIDLTSDEPKIVGQVHSDAQPSGISFTRDGKLALVANRAAGTVTPLSIDGQRVTALASVKVCEPADLASDVAVSRDGRRAYVSINERNHLRELIIDGTKLTPTERKISVYGKPYRVVVTSDGELCLTAGSGVGGAPDNDAVSIIDLTVEPVRAIQHVTIGQGPESCELSPDGNLLAVVLMNGSNLPPGNPLLTKQGRLDLLERQGKTYVPVQQLPIGPIPEGVAFTADGKKLVVQSHPERKLWVFAIENNRARDTGERIDVPGMASSLRAVIPAP